MPTRTPGSTAFVAELGSRAEAQHAPAVDGVTLASLHAAKGLEWDAVFLVGLVDGTLPITHATTPEQVAEEQRLLYVGITRARRWLHLSWAAARAAGGRRSRKPSRFLDALGAGRAPQPTARKPAKATAELAPEDAPTFESLREWRRQTADAAGMPPYIVFSDRTLVAIAAARPATRGHLARVPGVGPKKLDEYGEDVLRLVRESSS